MHNSLLKVVSVVFRTVFKKRKLLFVLVVISALIYVMSRYFTASSSSDINALVKKGDLKQELGLSGKIDAEEHVNLQFQTGGQLAFVGVKEGDYVQKNQLIATLDQRSMKKNLDKYLNAYFKTRMDFDQTKDDYGTGAISAEGQRDINKSQADLNNSVLDVELQDLAIKFASLITPIEGLVTRADVPQNGTNFYLPTQVQFEVVNPNTIYFDINADQTEVVNLKEGQTGTIILDSYPEEKIETTITGISFIPKKDETGTVYKVKATLNLPNSSYKYRLGMTGDITFTTQEKSNVLSIPNKFIKSDDKGSFVLLGKDKVKNYIKTGLETDIDTEIIEGLNEGDLVYD